MGGGKIEPCGIGSGEELFDAIECFFGLKSEVVGCFGELLCLVGVGGLRAWLKQGSAPTERCSASSTEPINYVMR